MTELFTMWKNTRMVILTAICAAAYVAVIVPFKGFVLIPGLTEVRPGAAIPIVLSFLFGPAAAWGSAFGNLIGDVIGSTIGPGSIPGFVGNFMYGYLPYALWRALKGDKSPISNSASDLATFVLVLVSACLAIGSIIGWGADTLKLVPFAALGTIIAVNNMIAAGLLSWVLLNLLYGRIRDRSLLFTQILDETADKFSAAQLAGMGQQDESETPVINDRKASQRYRFIGAAICIAGCFLSFGLGLGISAGFLDVGIGAVGFAAESGELAVTLGMLPGLAPLFSGAALL